MIAPQSSSATVSFFAFSPSLTHPDSARTVLYGPDALAKASPETTRELYLFGTPAFTASMSDTRRLREHRVQPWPRWRRADREVAGKVHESRAPRSLMFVGVIAFSSFLQQKPTATISGMTFSPKNSGNLLTFCTTERKSVPMRNSSFAD